MNAEEYIDDFVQGNLSGEDLKAFEAALNNDADLKEMVKQYQDLKHSAEGMGELVLLEEVEAITANDSSSVKKTAKDIKSKRALWVSVAIGFLVGFIITVFLLNRNTSKKEPLMGKQLIAAVLPEPLWPAINRSTDTTTESEIQKGYRIYRQKGIESAANFLQDSVENKDLGRYWLAEMYMEEGMAEEALELLPEKINTDTHSSRIILIKYVALLATKKVEEAKDIYQLLPQNYKQQIKKVIKE